MRLNTKTAAKMKRRQKKMKFKIFGYSPDFPSEIQNNLTKVYFDNGHVPKRNIIA